MAVGRRSRHRRAGPSRGTGERQPAQEGHDELVVTLEPPAAVLLVRDDENDGVNAVGGGHPRIAWLLTACSQESPTEQSSLDGAKGPSRGIVAVEVAMLPGDDDAYAHDVNSDGIVVGQSGAITDPWMKAYAVTATGPILLSTASLEGAAYGISEGPAPYVVGNDGGATGVGVRWRLTDPISREELDGSPIDVNSSGTATGSRGTSVALWSTSGAGYSPVKQASQ